jgi:hypothetical protein
MRGRRTAGSRLATLLVGWLLTVAVPAAPAAASGDEEWTLPPPGADWDYQLGGTHDSPGRVRIVVRDRRAPPADRYDVCYVNAFQTQPDERAFWLAPARRGLVLRRHGRPVVDEAWGEWLLDLGTAGKRARLARIVDGWVRRCAADGYDAVELDNLDSFQRSHRLLTAADARRYARMLVRRAHRAGLAVAQKNWVELGERGPRIGFDFAIAEECGRWRECAGYVAAYGRRVLVVEYTHRDLAWTCRHHPRLSVVRRDRDLAPDGVRRWCDG